MSKINLEKAKQILKETKQLTPETIREGVSIFNKKIVGKLTGLNGEEKTVLPSAFAHFVTPDAERGYDGITKITMPEIDSNIDPNLQSKNIKTGVTLFGVQGSCDPQVAKVQDKQLDLSFNGSYDAYPDYEYDGLNSIKINVNVPPAEGGNINTSGGTASSGSVSADKIGYVNGEGVVGNVKETLKLYTTPMTSTLDESKQNINFETEKFTTDRIFRQGSKIQSSESGSSLAKTVGVTPEKIFSGKTIMGITGTAGILNKEAPVLPTQKSAANKNHCEITIYPAEGQKGFSAVECIVDTKQDKDTPFDLGIKTSTLLATSSKGNFLNGELVGIKMEKDVDGSAAYISLKDKVMDVHIASDRNLIVLTKRKTGLQKDMGIYITLFEYSPSANTYFTSDTKGQKILDYTYIDIDFKFAGCSKDNNFFALDGDLFPIIFIKDIKTKLYNQFLYKRDPSSENILRKSVNSNIIVYQGVNDIQEKVFYDYIKNPDDSGDIIIYRGTIAKNESTFSLEEESSTDFFWGIDQNVRRIFCESYLDTLYSRDESKNKFFDYINILDAYWITEEFLKSPYVSPDFVYSPQPTTHKIMAPIPETTYTLNSKLFTNIAGDVNIYYNKEGVKEIRQNLDRITGLEEEGNIPQEYSHIFYNFNPSNYSIKDLTCSSDLSYMIINIAPKGSIVLQRVRLHKQEEKPGILYDLKGNPSSPSKEIINEEDEMFAFQVLKEVISEVDRIDFSPLRDAYQENLLLLKTGNNTQFTVLIPFSHKFFIKKIHNPETLRLNDIDGLGISLGDIPEGELGKVQVLLLREESKKLKTLGEK